MHISAFMTPVDKVVKCMPDDLISKALDLMVKENVGSVVVMNKDKNLRPLGIVTRSDMLHAYHRGLDVDEHTVTEIMHVTLTAVLDTMSRDEAAKVMEKNEKHHVIVIDKEGTFVGILSTMDIALEAARDARAWPWIRQDKGKFPSRTVAPGSPRAPSEETEGAQKRSSFIQYIDNLEYLDM